MDRFEEFEDYEDEDGDDEYDDFTDESPHLVNKWRESEISLRHDEMNLVVLEQTINILSSSILWKFKSNTNKVKDVINTYHALIKMIDINKGTA